MRRLLTLLILLATLLPWEAGTPPAQAQLADAPWPMFRHDLKHTGRSPYIGPQVPALKWSFTTGISIASSPAVGADGTVYVGSDNGKLYAVNSNGSLKWNFATGDQIWFSSPAIAADGTVYVGSVDKNLYALNLDGTLKWSFPTGGGILSSPALGPDGTVYVGSYDKNLYALNSNGSLKWSFLAGGFIFSSAAIAADGTVYVGSWDKKLYALNPDGSLKWSFATGNIVESSPAIAADGTIYVGSWDKKLSALNPDGTLKWSFLAGWGIFSSPAIAADGTIYVGSGDKKLYALNPDGTLKWSFLTGAEVVSSPAIGADGTIYVGSADSKLYAVNLNGTLKWSFATGGFIQSSPAIGADGTVYVGPNDGKLYAIGEAVPVPVASTTQATTLDSDGAAGVSLSIPQVYDAITLATLPGIKVGSYQATLQYNGTLLKVLDVRHKPPFLGDPTVIDNPGGSTLFRAVAPDGAPWPAQLAFVPLRLTGCITDAVTLTPNVSEVADGLGYLLQVDQPAAKTFRRGDAKADGPVNISDALYIASYLGGLKTLGEDTLHVNAVNAASIKHDGSFDRITVADILLLAQYVVGLRNNCFNLVP